jgi:hypothetical protein
LSLKIYTSVGGSVETEDDGLVDSEVDGLVETGTMFDCPIKGLKYGTGELVSETTSKDHRATIQRRHSTT